MSHAFYYVLFGIVLGGTLVVLALVACREAALRVDTGLASLDPDRPDSTDAWIADLPRWGEQAEESEFGSLISPLAPEVVRPTNLRSVEHIIPMQRGPRDGA